MVEIREIHGRRNIKKFIRFADKLNSVYPQYVPSLMMDELTTLDPDKNPAYDFCDTRFFMAYRDNKPVGRVLAINNKAHNEKTGEVRVRFSRLDFIDDEEVSAALIGAVEKWANELGAVEVIGPMGFCDLDKEGMLISGFDTNGMLITIYNAPYQQRHIEKLGYEKSVDWLEYVIHVPEKQDERLAKLSEMILKRFDLHMLNAKSMKEVVAHADGIFDVMDKAFDPLYGTVPLTKRLRQHYVKQFFGYLHPDFIPVVLDKDNNVVAAGVTAPSLAKAVQKCKGRLFPFGFIHLLRALKKPDRIELYLVGVPPELQARGLTAMLINNVMAACIKRGIKVAESGPELELNYKVQNQWKGFETEIHKRRRCYKKAMK